MNAWLGHTISNKFDMRKTVKSEFICRHYLGTDSTHRKTGRQTSYYPLSIELL